MRIKPTRLLLQTGIRHSLLQTCINHMLKLSIVDVPGDSLGELVQEPDVEERLCLINGFYRNSLKTGNHCMMDFQTHRDTVEKNYS